MKILGPLLLCLPLAASMALATLFPKHQELIRAVDKAIPTKLLGTWKAVDGSDLAKRIEIRNVKHQETPQLLILDMPSLHWQTLRFAVRWGIHNQDNVLILNPFQALEDRTPRYFSFEFHHDTLVTSELRSTSLDAWEYRLDEKPAVALTVGSQSYYWEDPDFWTKERRR